MSLTAIVFRKGHSADDDDAFEHIAAQARLGNVAKVWHVRDRLQSCLPADSVVLSRVLFSASHSGDEIGADLVPALRQELLVAAAEPDADVQIFLREMSSLVSAALEQTASISFV